MEDVAITIAFALQTSSSGRFHYITTNYNLTLTFKGDIGMLDRRPAHQSSFATTR